MKRRELGLYTLALLGASALVGCDSQADADYKGEALAALEGRVTNTLAEAPAATKVALVWVNSSGSPDRAFGESVDVTGQFPASFSLKLHRPPPVDMLNDFTEGSKRPGEAKIGVAHILVVKPGAALPDPEKADPLGMAENQLLVYVDRDVLAGSASEKFLGGAVKAGFHLMDVVRLTEQEIAAVEECGERLEGQGADEERIYFECGTTLDQLRPAAAGSKVQVRLGKELNWPNWT